MDYQLGENIMNRYIRMLKQFVLDPKVRFGYLTSAGFYNHMSDEEYLSRKYQLYFGQKPNLQNPQTFNEKLQWLKLYNRKPEYTMMVDKYKVREYIAQELGEEYLIPLLGVWDDPDEIDFDALPDQFVLKCNHNSGLGMCICKDKSKLDIPKVKAELRKGLKQDYYLTGREWPYKDVPRKIIAEKYLTNDGDESELSDYKVLCFNGKAKLIEIHRGRFSKYHTQDFYDTEWNKTAFEQPGLSLSDENMERPPFADKMLELSEKLVEGIPHVRIDWYYTGGRLKFGEITFYDGAGFDGFIDNQDEIIGSWITLPEKKL